MKVTKIVQQVKQRGRYSIFIDDKYSFSLSELAVINGNIAPGDELTEEQVVNFKQESNIDKIYNRTLGLLYRRPRSKWELESYLKRISDDSSHVEEILNRLTKSGFVDDYAFAKSWVESRRLLKSSSKRKLILELRQKHVPDQTINQVLSEDVTDELQVLRELVDKKKNQTRYHDKTKLMQYLSRQGFNYQEIKQVLEEY